MGRFRSEYRYSRPYGNGEGSPVAPNDPCGMCGRRSALTPQMVAWLRRLDERGHWPDGPFLADRASAVPLMRMGLVEVVNPAPVPGRAPGFPYATITPAGRRALAEQEARNE